MRLRVDLRDLVQTRHTQRLLQVFERALSLRILLVQEVIQNVLVSLDESL